MAGWLAGWLADDDQTQTQSIRNSHQSDSEGNEKQKAKSSPGFSYCPCVSLGSRADTLMTEINCSEIRPEWGVHNSCIQKWKCTYICYNITQY